MTMSSGRNCPLCGEVAAEVASGLLDETATPVYVRVLASRMADRWATLDREMQVWRCERCGLAYRYPFVAPTDLTSLYLDGTPVHKMGWKNLSDSLEHPWRGGYCAPLDLWRMLEAQIGCIQYYAEYGCPFQGFIVARAASAGSRERLRRRLINSWRQPYLDRLGSRSAFLHALANRIQPLRGLGAPSPTETWQQWGCGASGTYVVTDPTAQRWGLGCVQYANSCWQLAEQIEGVEVVSKPDLAEVCRGRRLSLLGFFDTLDHVSDLARTVNWALGVADAILIVNHASSVAARQHRFGLTSQSLQYIAQIEEGWTCIDLRATSPQLSTSHLWYLLVRNHTQQP